MKTRLLLHASFTLTGGPSLCGKKHTIRNVWLPSRYAVKTYAITCEGCRNRIRTFLSMGGKRR